MTETENLAILIDVMDQFSDELSRLLLLLENVQAVAEMVDDIVIDVSVRGEHELDMLMGRLAALESMDLSGIGDIVVGDKRVSRGGGGGRSRFDRSQFDRLDTLLGTQVKQMGRIMTRMDGAGDAMQAAGNAADSASDSMDVFDLRMSDLHNLLAKLVPLIFVIIGALPAVIGGLIALGAAAVSAAAGLMALAGLGALGFAMAEAGRGNLGEGFAQIGREVREDFLDAFLPLAQRLTPLFDDAIAGLDRLFQEIANRGDVLVKLGDEARAFGGFLIEFIPGALAAMGRMAQAFSGFFGMIADGMRDMSLLEGLTRFFAQAQPELTKFFVLLMPLIPALGNLSIGFLRVTNAILTLIAPFAKLAEMFPHAAAMVGAFIAALLTLITTMMIWSSVTALSATIVTSGLLPSVQAAAFSFITTYIPAVSYATASTLAFATAVIVATGGIAAVLGILGVLGSEFVGLSSDITDATESLKAFDSAASGVSGPNAYKHPDLGRGSVEGSSRFSGKSGGDVNVKITGHADPEQVSEQVENANYRMERPSRRL